MYVTISGCHGIGKTSISKLLAKRNGWDYIPEAVDTTISPPKFGPNSDHPTLGQYWFLRQMIEKENRLRTVGMDSIVICDRGWQDVLIYSKNLLTEDEHNIFKSIVSVIPKKIADLEIVLYTDHEKIIDRIKNRKRINLDDWGEGDIEYLKNINSSYKKYYDDFRDLKNIQLVDAGGDLEETYIKAKDIIEFSLR